MTTEELLARRERLLGVGAALFYEQPLQIVRGEGVWLFDADGNRYLDLYNNVPCVGHANPHVVEAMARQAATLNVHSRYLHEGILDYAERLTALHAAPITTAVFTCTGTEANEVALMMARVATGGRGIITTDAAYHGNSAEVRKLSRLGDRAARELPLDPEVRAIPVPQHYRPIARGLSEAELCERYLAELRTQIDGFRGDGIPFAGMLLCPLLANEGLPDIPRGFMAGAAQIVREAGGLFICDEVQAGFGRSGRWWGYEVMDCVPDIVVMGKPMGNGLPLAGVVARGELVNAFRRETRYFNTFASSPLQAAVGMAVIDVIEQEDLLARVGDVGEYMRTELRAMQDGCEPMADVRGHGLFIGVEWVSDRETEAPDVAGAQAVVEGMKRRGVLMGKAGAHGNVLKMRPPLVFEREHADRFLEAFRETIHEVHARGSA
ncbi:MAG: aspartate aminotransferase family protein [Chloroflexi bacterium]|nr:aspartate aminotransferase family protein [Chloroflexota bacterium]MDA1004239.1 aspartate aminotransferase family protein [Chloroflexota bacterium]